MNAEAFKEVITEYSKHVQGVTPEMVMRELSDPKKTAEMTTMLEKKIQEKYYGALADIAEYGFNMEASRYIDHQIDPDREGYMWTYDILFRIADDKDTLTIKLKSCIHNKKDWYLTEGIKVKRYYKPVQMTPEYKIIEPEYQYQGIEQEGEEVPPPLPVMEEYHGGYDTGMDDVVMAPVEEPYIQNVTDTNAIMAYAEEQAQYLGADIRTEIAQKLQYPTYEKEVGIEGSVYVEMIIERNGTTSGHKVLRSVPGAKNFDKEALDVLKRLDYAFKPARHNGKVVRSKYIIPVKFVLK
jgi:TonB family protein